MPIISVEIMKTIDKRGKWDARCVVMRWSNEVIAKCDSGRKRSR